MTDVDKIAFAVGWYELRQCPGCFAPLEDVAGMSAAKHFRGGQTIYLHGGAVTTEAGRPMGSSMKEADPRLCAWSSDDLTSLVLIGSGIVKYDRGTGGTNRPPAGEDGPLPRDCPDPVASLTGHCQGGGQHES